MSQANIPNITPNISLTREESINLILASIALEELGLAHIINAEAEKIQYAIGTLSGLSPVATLDEILAVNESVNQTIQSALKTQMLLQNKLDSVIQTPVLTGPTGLAGVSGPLITANNARITNAATQTVAAGAAVPLAFNNVVNGTAITYVPGSTDIVLAPNQTYYVSYEAESTIGTAGFVQLQLNLNGSLVGGT
ncbi:hypothetical protein [Bacillus sp. OTC-L18]|uniref:hypothetical protein n=1 Tax=Bacillus sp. OTC-L18 TaxID=3342792 RepID=UPI0035B80470